MRFLVLSILLLVAEGNEKSHLAIRGVLDKYSYFEPQKKAQIKRLSEGVLERMLTLDAIIDQFSKTPTKKMKPVIRNILRLAVYEMKYQDSVPVSASVNEAVKLAEQKGFRGLKGFVNGVLRQIARSLPSLTLPDTLSIRYSMPEYLVSLWTESYGKEKTEEVLSGFEGKSPLTVHHNREAVSEAELLSLFNEEGVRFEETDLPGAYRLDGVEGLLSLPSFRKGAFFVQDLSCMKALSTVTVTPEMTVLDVCGAPGGKSLFLAEALRGTGEVVCRDISEKKADLIRENIERCGFRNCRAEVFDARDADPAWREQADLVIADLPCSGLGVLSRKPEVRYRIGEEEIRSLVALQREMLSVAAEYVKPGGELLYSTCTISPAENEENTAYFLRSHPEFRKSSEEQLFPISGVQDGFYYALLQRKA